MGLCGQGRGSGSSPGKMLPCSWSMYPSWSLILILIWSWILMRLRNGGTMIPVQTFRIPAEPKRRRQVRITPSEKYSKKMSINASTREFNRQHTLYNKSQKLGFTLENKRRAKAKKNKKNTSFGSPNTKWYTELKTFNNGTLLSSVCKKLNSLIMQISQLTRHSHHTIGATHDSSSCLS